MFDKEKIDKINERIHNSIKLIGVSEFINDLSEHDTNIPIAEPMIWARKVFCCECNKPFIALINDDRLEGAASEVKAREIVSFTECPLCREFQSISFYYYPHYSTKKVNKGEVWIRQ